MEEELEDTWGMATLPVHDEYKDELISVREYLHTSFSPDCEYVDGRIEERNVGRSGELDGKLIIDTREELIEHGGFVSRFSLNLISSNIAFRRADILSFYLTLMPRFSVPSPLREIRWELFGKVEQVFAARKDVLKSAAVSLPGWYSNLTIVIPIIVLGLIAALKFVFKITVPLWAVVALFSTGFVFSAPVGLSGLYFFKKNGIYLRRIRQDEKEKKLARKERIEKLIWLILGTFLGAIGTLISNQLKR